MSMSGDPFVDIPCRPMRVKILYTFDNDNATNCLARIPDIINIRSIPIDEASYIGLIEVRQCINAIITASPELITRLAQGDFTIYAYDYSEVDVPLVGQGMLSSVLTNTNAKNKSLITGKVCKNAIGLFTNGTAETLEVKLRLVPVLRPNSNDFSRNLELQRHLSPALSGIFDANMWAESLASESNLVATLERQSSTYNTQNGSNFSHQRHTSNASMSGRPTGLARHATQSSRPGSRNSIRSEPVSRGQQQPDIPSAFQDDYEEDGHVRKRIKTTQTDWAGRSNIADNADSLRVSASTAASIRVHKPVATRFDSYSGQNNLEPPPRAPTPIPRHREPGLSRTKSLTTGTLMRRESMLQQTQDMYDNQSEPLMSPSDTHEGCSPLEFPSSPPGMPEPFSPTLPSFSRPIDSGFLSGDAFENLQSEDEGQNVKKPAKRTYNKRKALPESKLGSDTIFIEQQPGPPELLPTSTRIFNPNRQKARNSISHSISQSSNKIVLLPPARPSLVTQHSAMTYSDLPDMPDNCATTTERSHSQPPAFLAPRNLSRNSAASPSPIDEPAFGGKPRSGSGAKRSQIIHDKLMNSLATGTMPTFCANCGAIETPTWRSLHVKTVDGCPEDHGVQDLEGETTGTEVLEKDEETGKTTKYRIVKSIRKTKDRPDMEGFDTISVCNPCGLWFNKLKYMRPQEKWGKNTKVSNKKRATKREGMTSDAVDAPSDINMPWNDQIPVDNPAGNINVVWNDQGTAEDSVTNAKEERTESNSPTLKANSMALTNIEQLINFEGHGQLRNRPRANSVQMQDGPNMGSKGRSGKGAESLLRRAIQSSPVRTAGTQDSPIELEDDLTPKPIRRLLFPTPPRREGESRSLEDGKSISKSNNKQTNNIISVDKENLSPISSEDDISKLFDCSPSIFFKTPSKLRQTSNNFDMKTPPSKSTVNFDDLFATPTPIRHVNFPITTTATATATAITTTTTTTRTPSRNMDAFLPSFSSAEKREIFGTPGKYGSLSTSNDIGLGFSTTPSRCVSNSSIKGGNNTSGMVEEAMTPFTRHLNQLLASDHGFISNSTVVDMNSLQFDDSFTSNHHSTVPVQNVVNDKHDASCKNGNDNDEIIHESALMFSPGAMGLGLHNPSFKTGHHVNNMNEMDHMTGMGFSSGASKGMDDFVGLVGLMDG